MHLGFGKLIWQFQGLPEKEPFVYTSLERPFSYSSWLFAVIYYLSYLAFNFYGVIILKAVTITTAFYILIRDSLRSHKNYIIAIVVMTIVVIMARHRFVERPDTFMMVFLPFSIFSLNAYVYDNKKYIYALPFVHMLWANSHSSIAIMFIPFAAFIAGGVLQRYFGQKGLEFSSTPSSSMIRTILIIFIASFAASLISPYFISQYFYGAQSLATPWIKQAIHEIQPPTWQTNKWPYLMTAFIMLSFIIVRKRFSIIHFFIVVPFIILSFTAIRFVFLLGIVSGPILVRNISTLCESNSWNNFLSRKVLTVVTAIWLILYTTLSLMQVKPFDVSNQVFGFGINYDTIPEGALKYMDRHNIKGRIYNNFNWGGYINWRDFPIRTVFADQRWYIPSDLLEGVSASLRNEAVLDKLQKKYGFESILMECPVFHGESSWALVYWDKKSFLYLKRGGKYDSVIRRDEYRFVKSPHGEYSIESVGSSKEGEEHFKNGLKAYGKGKLDIAIDKFKKSIEANPSIPAPYSNLGYVYLDLGNIDKAYEYQKKSLDIDPNFAVAHYGLALIYKRRGDIKGAKKHWEEYLRIEPTGYYSQMAKKELKSLKNLQ
jgi:hypothetical protein